MNSERLPTGFTLGEMASWDEVCREGRTPRPGTDQGRGGVPLVGVIERIPERLRGLHADRRAQIMPLVFFLGIAFLTSVFLVFNTGRTVNVRIENQNAVDAAAVSGSTCLARGMNYLASNNLAQARILSVVVVLRAVPQAVYYANKTLLVWDGVVLAMRAAAAGLKSNPFTAAIGVALDIAATVLKIKIKIEKIILKGLGKLVDGMRWFDSGIGKSSQPNPPSVSDLRTNPKKLAWSILKGMSVLSKVIAYWGPVVAHYTAQVVYQANLPSGGRTGFAVVLPLYPGMPVCKAGFIAFQHPLVDPLDDPATDDSADGFVPQIVVPIRTAGWIVLTLSFWPLYFNEGVNMHMKVLFTPKTATEETDNPLDDLEDETTERANAIARAMENASVRLKEAQIELRNVETELARLEGGELAYEREALRKAREAAAEHDEETQDDQDDYHDHGGTDEDLDEDVVDPTEAIERRIQELEDEAASLPSSSERRWEIEEGSLGRWRGEETDAETDLGGHRDEMTRLLGAANIDRNLRNETKKATDDTRTGVPNGLDDARDSLLDARGHILDQKQEDLSVNEQKVADKAQVLAQDCKRLATAKRRVEKLNGRKLYLLGQRDKKRNAVEYWNAELQRLMREATTPPESELDLEPGDTSEPHVLDRKVYPWLLDATDWSRRATILVVAGRGFGKPLGASDDLLGLYGETFQPNMPVALTYAAARVFAPPGTANLWTTNWRGRLVRVGVDAVPGPADLFARVPGTCATCPPGDAQDTPTMDTIQDNVWRVVGNQFGGGGDDGAGSESRIEDLRNMVGRILEFFSKH